MKHKLHPKGDRLNVQIPSELKSRLYHLSEFQGKKISALVRESIEDKLDAIENKIFEDKMKSAYLAMAQENLEFSEEFRHVDSENL